MSSTANPSPTRVELRRPYQPKHPFADAFLNLASYTPAAALEQLARAVRDNRKEESAYDWVTATLPGATLKPAIAIGTVGELYRKFSSNQEFLRFTQSLTASR